MYRRGATYMGITGWNKGMSVKEKQWHHITLTYNGKVFDMYLDGKRQDDYQIKANGKLSMQGPFYVGSRHTGIGEDYLGLVDELAVYSGILGQAKIKEIMENGVLGQFAVDGQKEVSFNLGRAQKPVLSAKWKFSLSISTSIRIGCLLDFISALPVDPVPEKPDR